MEEKNELSDILLTKGAGSGGSKKVLVAVASLAIVLIIVIVIMGKSSGGTSNLPQAVLPPEPVQEEMIEEDPLFEPVEVVEEDISVENDNLDKIAQKLKEQTLREESQTKEIEEEEVTIVEEPIIVEEPAPVVRKKVAPKKSVSKKPSKTVHGKHYVQVGSFTRFEPNKKLLNAIKNAGYAYTYHEVTRNGKVSKKVLVGPFNTKAEAKKALSGIRKRIEKGAFITKV